MSKLLASRIEEFHKLITEGQVSDRQGNALSAEAGVEQALGMLESMRDREGQAFVVGNGGSAAVAGHAVTDFVNAARLRAITVHDSSLLTCMANDYGYENAYARMVASLFRSGDLLIVISSSGQSANILNTVKAVRDLGGPVMTLSGFREDNPLRQSGDLNYWLPREDYGLVEIGHLFFLHFLADRCKESGAHAPKS